MYHDQNLCEAFHGGGEDWEVFEALHRVQDRLWEMYVDHPMDGSISERSLGEAYDIIRDLKQQFETVWSDG